MEGCVGLPSTLKFRLVACSLEVEPQQWGGILVEGSLDNYRLLLRNVHIQARPRAVVHWGAVCAPPKTHLMFAQGNREVGMGAI